MIEVKFGGTTKRKRVVVVHESGEPFHLESFGGLIGHDITGKSDVQS